MQVEQYDEKLTREGTLDDVSCEVMSDVDVDDIEGMSITICLSGLCTLALLFKFNR